MTPLEAQCRWLMRGPAEVWAGDNLAALAGLPDNSVDAIVTDPPYGLGKEPDALAMLRDWMTEGHHDHKGGSGFMGKTWDAFVPQPALWRECYRVLKPGSHVLAFAGTRTQDLVCLGLRIAGFEIRDLVAWVYGCLDEQTQLVTASGVIPYHKAKIGDPVLCYNADTGAYSYEPILEIVEYDYCDTAYRLVGDFGEQVVSRNHRVIVERDGVEAFELAEALQHEARVPVLEDLRALQVALYGGDQGAGDQKPDVRACVRGVENGRAYADGEAQGQGGAVCGLRRDGLEADGMAAQDCGADLQQAVQRGAARFGVGGSCPQGPGVVAARVGSGIAGPDDGRDESVVEGRRDVPESEGRVCEPADQVRSLPAGVSGDGTPGRICDGASTDRCEGGRSDADAGRGGASRESRRDGQSPVEPDAVRNKRGAQVVRAWGGHRSAVVRVVPFHYTGKVWCLRVPTGAFVAVRNGVAFPTGNSGFPKSLDVSKAIDRAAGAEREVTGDGPFAARRPRADKETQGSAFADDGYLRPAGQPITAPATDAAVQWQGWGTALKPALEPITLARKPLVGTVAANVLAHGTGALNIDGCRVEAPCDANRARPPRTPNSTFDRGKGTNLTASEHNDAGRWPANLAHDGSAEVLGAFPSSKSGTETQPRGTGGIWSGVTNSPCGPQYGDSGSAARFYYCAKASKRDREEGLEGFEVQAAGGLSGRSDGSLGSITRRANVHPTVKPTDLMRWLCRLVTPPGGLVLDPFAGSGSTGKAAVLEGFRFLGLELSDEYAAIANARIEAARRDRA